MLNTKRRFFIKNFAKYSIGAAAAIIIPNYIFNNYSYKFISYDFYLMGTYGRIQIFLNDMEYGKLLIQNIINKIQNLESLLTKFSPNSDIGRINNNPKIRIKVSEDTIKLLKIGNNLSTLTDGYFDMGMGNFLTLYRIDSDVPLVGSITNIDNMKYDLLSITDNFVKLNRENSMLDLGGIGKGYAVDQIVNFLKNAGITYSAVEFGGDIRVMGGMPSGEKWKIYIDKTISYNSNNYIYIKDGSLALSGNYRKNFYNNHHIINPKTLKSESDKRVMVFGESCTICDALSTAFFNINKNNSLTIKNRFNGYSVNIF
jgi:FAD:protein FMN transferase